MHPAGDLLDLLLLELVFQQPRQQRGTSTKGQNTHRGPGEGLTRTAHLLQRLTRLDGHHRWRSNSTKGAKCECMQWHSNYRRCQIDEPIGQDRCHAQKEHIVEETVPVLLHMPRPFTRLLWPKVSNQPSSDQVGKRIAQRGAQR